jgi:hypothetical protein
LDGITQAIEEYRLPGLSNFAPNLPGARMGLQPLLADGITAGEQTMVHHI